MSSAPTVERRHNRPLRNQAQAWFEALQIQIADVAGAESMVALMKEWKKPEDMMRDHPALVPLFLDLVWHSRKTPAFADLLRGENGDVVETTSEVLAISKKTFDEVIIAHLMGTMRLTCERNQNEWLAAERERRRSKLSFVGATLHAAGLKSLPQADALLADYPQKGLYEALKPFLSRREQFLIVDGLCAIPTRTASLLGPVVGALQEPAAIRALAALDRADTKTAIELAESYVQASQEAPKSEGADEASLIAPRAHALSELLTKGGHLISLAAGQRQLANDAVTKLAPAVGADTWALCEDVNALRRVAECPAAVAKTLKQLTVEISERVSIALSEAEDQRVASYAVGVLRDRTAPETFLSWLKDETYLSAWKQLVANLNRTPVSTPEGEPLGPNLKSALKIVCERGADVFAELGDAAPKAA